MPNFLKIAEGINISPLQMALVRQPELFGRRTLRADRYDSPHAQMTDIWVRYNEYSNLDRSPATFNDEHDSVWYPEAECIPEVRGIVMGLMTHVGGERLGGVLITKIPPGGGIAPHVDTGWHAEYYDKYYVPILNDVGSVFGFPDGEINAIPGEAYWFRNDVSHWVKNDSQRDRIAMIVCIRTNKSKGE